MKIITLFCSLILVLSACTHTSSDISAGSRDYYENSYLLSCDYQNAVIDAVIPAQSRIYNGLTEIKSPEDNSQQERITVNNKKMVLVTTLIKEEVLKYWMSNDAFTVKVDCWVSVPSEWKKFKEEFAGLNDKAKRIRMLQLLGMPGDSTNSVMVEFYADAESVFRPSKDRETCDRVASLEFPANTDSEYRKWFEEQKDRAYKSSPGFPFTQLGYSYDWNHYSKNNIGLSEFVVPKGTLVKVKNRLNYQDFIKEIR